MGTLDDLLRELPAAARPPARRAWEALPPSAREALERAIEDLPSDLTHWRTLLDLALDVRCPARRFALHCLYIYAADAIRTKFRAHPKRRLRKLVEQAEEEGDDVMDTWAHNTRVLLAVPDLFDYREWCEGGLVRHPRRLKTPAAIPGPRLASD